MKIRPYRGGQNPGIPNFSGVLAVRTDCAGPEQTDEVLGRFDTVGEAADFLRGRLSPGLGHLVMAERFRGWNDNGETYWYADELMLVTDASGESYIPVCETACRCVYYIGVAARRDSCPW